MTNQLTPIDVESKYSDVVLNFSCFHEGKFTFTGEAHDRAYITASIRDEDNIARIPIYHDHSLEVAGLFIWSSLSIMKDGKKVFDMREC